MSPTETVFAWILGGTAFLSPLGVLALMWWWANKGEQQ